MAGIAVYENKPGVGNCLVKVEKVGIAPGIFEQQRLSRMGDCLDLAAGFQKCGETGIVDVKLMASITDDKAVFFG